MDTAVILLTLLMLLPSVTPAVTPIQLSPGCQVSSHLKQNFIGPVYNITKWNSDENDDLFTFALPTKNSVFIGLRIQKNYAEYVHGDSITITRHKRVIDPPLGVGWVNIRVEVGQDLKVTIDGRTTITLDVDVDLDEFKLDKIDISGNNITVNCLGSIKMWRVSNGATQVLPLAGAGTHEVTVYTLTSSRPQVSVGYLDHLTFNNETPAQRRRRRSPALLSPLTTHTMTVVCLYADTGHLTCTMNVSGERRYLTCPVEGCYLAVSGRPQDNFLVYLQDQTKALNEDPTLTIHDFKSGSPGYGIAGLLGIWLGLLEYPLAVIKYGAMVNILKSLEIDGKKQRNRALLPCAIIVFITIEMIITIFVRLCTHAYIL